LQKAIKDWRAIAHGARTEEFRQDMQDLWRRDTAAGVPMSKWSSDIADLNEQLKNERLLPNLSIVGVHRDRVVLKDTSRPGQYGILTDGMGMTQVEDLQSPAGPMRVNRDRPPSDNALFRNVSPSGVHQGDEIGDCRFEAYLTALAQSDPQAVARMVRNNHDGTYTVTFPGDPSHPERVPAPTPWERNTFSDGGAEWASVVSKAYRTRMHEPFGSGTESAQGFEGLLTGRSHAFIGVANMDPCDAVVLRQDQSGISRGNFPVCRENLNNMPISDLIERYNNKSLMVDPRDLGNALQTALQDHMLITTGFAPRLNQAPTSDRHGTDSSGRPVNLFTEHAYTVIAYDAKTQTVTLRNPWGKNIDAETGKLIGDGTVLMPMSQFARYTDGLNVEKSALSV
jgi:hypothetical protein